MAKKPFGKFVQFLIGLLLAVVAVMFLTCAFRAPDKISFVLGWISALAWSLFFIFAMVMCVCAQKTDGTDRAMVIMSCFGSFFAWTALADVGLPAWIGLAAAVPLAMLFSGIFLDNALE